MRVGDRTVTKTKPPKCELCEQPIGKTFVDGMRPFFPRGTTSASHASASAFAIASPIPEPPPVTIATFPSSPLMLPSIRFR